MQGPPGWFPDPSGRPQLRYFDGWRWTDWVSLGGQTLSMPLAPPATGGGTLVTEPVLVTAPGADGGFRVTTPAGLALASAVDPDGGGRRLEVADPSGHAVLRLRRTGIASAATVAVRQVGGAPGNEVGRFELAGRQVRVLARGALVAVVGVPLVDEGPVGVVDADAAPIGRIHRSAATWTTEVARPLGDPLHPLVALAALATELLERTTNR